MERSTTALKATPDPASMPTQMDWIGLIGKLERTAFHTPLRWTRIAKDQPTRIRPWKIREKLRTSRRGIQVQIKQVLSDTLKGGDIQPVEWLTNEFKVDPSLSRLAWQKNAAGEKVAWDTWVRIAPPEVMNARQTKEQATYTKNLTDALESERAKVEGYRQEGERIRSLDEGAREIYYLERDIPDLPKPIREREQERLRQLRAVRTIAYRKNQRYGMDGWREWRISVLRETMERNKAKFGKKEEK